MRYSLFSLGQLILASPWTTVNRQTEPSVTFHPKSAGGQGVTVHGTVRPGEKFESYLGIPFAEPPVGALRWKPSQPYDFSQTQDINATAYRSACVQISTFGSHSPTPDDDGGAGTGEDCLFLNVFTPPGASAKPGRLPVIVTIYGGGYTSGSAQAGDPRDFMPNAADTGLPVLWVSLNYRLGAFGWPNGPHFAETGSANLGLTDAINALECVQENIAAFGGDPNKVTLLGQSAGAGVISLLYLQHQRELFRSAILMSGAPPVLNVGPTEKVSPAGWSRFFELLNCTDSDQVTCAQGHDTADIVKAYDQLFKEFPRGDLVGPSIDGHLVAESPYTLLESGRWARRPFIAGNTKDEGTLFASATANETTLRTAMGGSGVYHRTDETINQLLHLYPADPSQGSPFDTGDQLFNNTVGYKRTAAYSGDAIFHAPRRNFFDVTSEQGFNQTWSFIFDHVPKGIAANPAQGVFHGADLNFTRGRPTESDAPWWTPEDISLSKAIMEYWLRFTYFLDPNGQMSDRAAADSSVVWPRYNGPEERNIMLLRGDGRSVIRDDFRSEAISYINSRKAEYGY